MKKLIINLKTLISKMDKTLLMLTVVFFLYGLLNITTASSREAIIAYNESTYYYFFRQLIMLSIGLVGSYIVLNLRTQTYKNLIYLGYIIVLSMVVMLFPFGVEVNGAKNWLPLPGIGTVQPSEFAKPVMIILFAVLFDKNYKLLKSKEPARYKVIAIIISLALLIPALTFIQVDFGGVLIMLGTFGVMFLASPIKKIDKLKVFAIGVGLVIIFAAVVVLRQGYLFNDAQLSRFNYFNPCSNYEDNGYQVCNSFIALSEGGMFGVGIGKSRQKYSYIPEPHTDSIFAIIAEENGVVGSTIILIGYIIVIYRILKISKKTTSLQNYYICLGIATYIFLHIFINLGGIFGLIPLTGVPLPFLSYGGTYAISLMASLSVVQRINIETHTKKNKKAS